MDRAAHCLSLDHVASGKYYDRLLHGLRALVYPAMPDRYHAVSLLSKHNDRCVALDDCELARSRLL